MKLYTNAFFTLTLCTILNISCLDITEIGTITRRDGSTITKGSCNSPKGTVYSFQPKNKSHTRSIIKVENPERPGSKYQLIDSRNEIPDLIIHSYPKTRKDFYNLRSAFEYYWKNKK